MRNNQERLSANLENDKSSSDGAIAQQSGGDFSFIAANDIVELPSKGILYPEGHPLHANPVVELKQMTAKEEDILTNQSYIKQGVVIERLLNSLVVDKNLNLDDLLIGDKNAILIELRKSAYGNSYPVNTFCRKCMHQQEVDFDLAECTHYRETAATDEVELTDRNTYIVQMPKTKATLELRFLTSRDEKELAQKQIKYEKHKLEYSSTIETYRQMITSVNGERNLVGSYLEKMPLQDSRHLKKIARTVPPTAEMIGEYICSSCGENNEQEVPITYRFFWPDF